MKCCFLFEIEGKVGAKSFRYLNIVITNSYKKISFARPFIVIFLFCILEQKGSIFENEASMDIKVMSFNIRFENPSDGKHNWPYRKHLLGEIIHQFSPHLLGTQEGRRPQLLELAKLLPEWRLADQHREWISDRMYPTIFYHPKFIEVMESGDIWLSQTPSVVASKSFDSVFPRLCTWIKGRFIETKQAFIYINTHLDHLKAETRIEQTKVLIQEVKKLLKDSNPFIILSGDFNDHPNGAVYKNIFSSFPQLYDPWVYKKQAEETSFHKFKPEFLLEPSKGKRIDWIFVSSQFKTNSIELDKTSKGQLFPSDHFPVKASFSL